MDLFEKQSCEFITRHIGPDEHSTKQMLKTVGVPDLDTLVNKTVPPAIRMQHELNLPAAMSEHQYLQHIKEVSLQNKVYKNYIGQGYYDTIVPSVILRNVFENPGWYTQYTPYQAEISQGRLESLLNFQTMVSDLTALPIANASLLDEEGDFIVNTKPCPFLGADNFCSIYEDRPSDCRRFPYTDEDVIIKRKELTLKNSTFCPITYYVLEKLIEKI